MKQSGGGQLLASHKKRLKLRAFRKARKIFTVATLIGFFLVWPVFIATAHQERQLTPDLVTIAPVDVNNLFAEPTRTVDLPIVKAPEPVPSPAPKPKAPSLPSNSASMSKKERSEQWRPLVAKYFPSGQINNAILVISCESGGDPAIVSPTRDYGLFQVNRAAHEKTLIKRGLTIDSMKNPEENVKFAAELFRSGQWGDWFMSNKCHHLL